MSSSPSGLLRHCVIAQHLYVSSRICITVKITIMVSKHQDKYHAQCGAYVAIEIILEIFIINYLFIFDWLNFYH